MSDEEASFDEIAAEQSPQDEEGPTRHGRRRAPRKHSALRGALPVLLVVLVLVGATVGGVTGYRWLTSNVSVESEETDFPGPGRRSEERRVGKECRARRCVSKYMKKTDKEKCN